MFSDLLSLAISLLILLNPTPSLAQSLTDLPECAQGPALQSIGSTGCQLTDIKCICSNQDFVKSLTEQIQKDCKPDDIAKVAEFSQKLCGSVGVTVSAASSGAAGAGTTPTGSASAGASTSGATRSAPTGTTTATTSATSGSASPATFSDAAGMLRTDGSAALLAGVGLGVWGFL